MSYINPVVVSIPNAKGLDLAVKGIQNSLSSLTWLDKIFGRALPFLDYEGDRTRRVTTGDGIVPKVFESRTTDGKSANYYSVLQNDNLDAFCFFYAEGRETPNDYSSSSMNSYNRPMSLIVWVRLNKVDSSKTYNYLGELKDEIYSVLKKNKNVKVTGYEDETDEVLSGFNRLENFNFRYPNVGMRIFFDLQYYEDCNTAANSYSLESLTGSNLIQVNSSEDLLTTELTVSPSEGNYKFVIDANDTLPDGFSLSKTSSNTAEINYSGVELGSHSVDFIAYGIRDTTGYATIKTNILVTRDVIQEVKDLLKVGNDRGFQLPSATVQDALSVLISSQKSRGIWDSKDFVYALATDGDADFACLNIKDPGDEHYLRRVNSPIFTPLSGIAGNGVNAYLEPCLKLGFDTVNFDSASAGVSLYVKNPGISGGSYYTDDTLFTRMLSQFSTSARIITASNLPQNFNTERVGYYQVYSNGSNSFYSYDGNTEINDAPGATLSWRGNIRFFANVNVNGNFSQASTAELSHITIGGNEQDNVSENNTDVNNYLTTIGAI